MTRALNISCGQRRQIVMLVCRATCFKCDSPLIEHTNGTQDVISGFHCDVGVTRAFLGNYAPLVVLLYRHFGTTCQSLNVSKELPLYVA